jgi:DNA-binding SARP family transcriptional activator
MKGELLPDDRYEEWTVERREALARRYVALLSDLAALLECTGEFPRAAENLRRVLAADPTNEEAHTRLMRVFALMGQRQEALRQFHDLQTALKEIDADPQPASVELHKVILAGDLAKLAGAASRPLAGSAPPSRRPVRAAPAVRRKHTGDLPPILDQRFEAAQTRDLRKRERLLRAMEVQIYRQALWLFMMKARGAITC